MVNLVGHRKQSLKSSSIVFGIKQGKLIKVMMIVLRIMANETLSPFVDVVGNGYIVVQIFNY